MHAKISYNEKIKFLTKEKALIINKNHINI